MSDKHIEIVERFMKLCDISYYDKAAEFVNKHNIDHGFLDLLENKIRSLKDTLDEASNYKED